MGLGKAAPTRGVCSERSRCRRRPDRRRESQYAVSYTHLDVYKRQPQVCAQLTSAQNAIATGQTAEAACAALPAGPSRNALDCALWDLRAKTSGQSIWQLAGLASGPDAQWDARGPEHLTVDQTIGLGSPEAMAKAALVSGHAVLKTKLDAELIVERVRACLLYTSRCV